MLLKNAIGRHTTGDLDGAERIYRALLDDNSDLIPALHLLGSVHGQRGELSDAAACLERALALAPEDVDILADLANVRRLQARPDDAARLLEAAVGLEPERAALQHALSGLYLESGDTKAAISCLERTVALDSGHADAHNDLGAAYLESGRYAEAQRLLEAAARLRPDSPVAYRNLANLFSRLGEPARSVQYYREALERAPEDHEIRTRLAGALLQIGDSAAALKEYRALAERKPGDAQAWSRLAEIAARLGRRMDAITWYRRSLEIEPRQPVVLNDLGIVVSENGEYEDAAELLERAGRLRPGLDRAYHNLAATYHLQGRYEEAVQAYEKALDIDPLNTLTLSNFIAITNYRNQGEAGFIDKLHARYLRSLAPERVMALRQQQNDFTQTRRLRVGYVSPDFRQHSVAYFIDSVIAEHDRRRFEVYCYSDVAQPDAVTERLKSLADYWRDVSADGDETLARRIRDDGIDLLVDLDGHAAGNRLPVFAQKPAPVQISYLGYPATTGLPEIDFRITDGVADPPESVDSAYSEILVRLPEGFLCYRPSDAAPPVAAAKNDGGAIIFGCFNELPKVSPEVVRSWSRILERLPGSRLLLKATALVDPGTRARVKRRFELAGVSPDRIELFGRTATLEEHLALYARVDVALDTFPYNGTTTTCEALYMGVPVVTLEGAAHAGRVGTSLLSMLQLTELVAASEDKYVDTAVALAADEERRVTFRTTLRGRLRASALCDSKAFVPSLEAIYLDCWSRRCESENRSRDEGDGRTRVVGALDLEICDGSLIVVPDDLDQLTAYVLLEQQDWFEDETDFVRNFLRPGMRVLDVGANFGVYTLLAAKCVGQEGRVFSIEPASTTVRWLRASVVLNKFETVEVLPLALSDQNGELTLSLQAGAECNRLVNESAQIERGERVKALRLDDCAHEHGIESVDLVKLDAEGAEKQIIDGGQRFFSEESPLLMFEIKSAQDVDLDLIRKFDGLGYKPFRLIPGLAVLAPLDLSRPLDAYALNIFACKKDQQLRLVDRGLLVKSGVDFPHPDGAVDGKVWEYFLSKTFSKGQVEGWKSRLGSPSAAAGKRWMRVLGHYVAACDETSPPWQRVLNLEDAFHLATAEDPDVHPAARLSSLARIAWALGRRAQALDALGELKNLGGDLADAFERPFLPASPHFDNIEAGDRRAAWCEACVLDQFECLRTFSSYFLENENADALDRLKQSGFQRTEMERRRLLVRLRHGLPLVDASPEILLKSPSNRNPEFWRSRLSNR